MEAARDFIKEDIPKLWKSAAGKLVFGIILYVIGFQGDWGFVIHWVLRILMEIFGFVVASFGLWELRRLRHRKRIELLVTAIMLLIMACISLLGIRTTLIDTGVIIIHPAGSGSVPSPTTTTTSTETATELAAASPPPPTKTSVASATNEPTIIATPESPVSGDAVLLFMDDFSSASTNHWSLGSRSDEYASGQVNIERGKFIVEAEFKEGSVRWSRLYEDVKNLSYIEVRDFVLQINAKLLQAVPDGDVWITIHFRINENFDNYSLRINQNQMYSLVVRTGTSEKIIRDWTVNENILLLSEINNIMIVVIGSEFTIYLNGHLVDLLIDNDLMLLEPGGFALGVRSSENSFVIVEYDDLSIHETHP